MLKDIDVYYQPKAWFDTPTSMQFAENFNRQTPDGNTEKLLGLDNLGSQCAPEFKKRIREGISLLIYTPENCTDLCAVTDKGLGMAVKGKMNQKFDEHFDNNTDDWVEGKITTSQRRLLYAKWLSETWKECIEKNQAQITKAFVQCGMLNAVDDSEDTLIH